jgi:hypothetical protein
MADAMIVTGSETGATADPKRVADLRRTLPDAPLVVGSGITDGNAASFAEADAAIVGTWIKRDGQVDAEVDRDRVDSRPTLLPGWNCKWMLFAHLYPSPATLPVFIGWRCYIGY